MQSTNPPRKISIHDVEKFISIDDEVLRKQAESGRLGFDKISDPVSNAIAAALKQNDVFHEWLESTTSGVLLVKGKMESTQGQKAVTSQAITKWVLPGILSSKSPEALFLNVRYAELATSKKTKGLSGMLRFVAAQLKPHTFATSNVIDPPYDTFLLSPRKVNEVPDLCDLLELMMENVKHKFIYLVVDSVCLAEAVTPEEDVLSFAKALRELLRLFNGRNERSGKHALKVWLTNPAEDGPIVKELSKYVFDLSSVTYTVKTEEQKVPE